MKSSLLLAIGSSEIGGGQKVFASTVSGLSQRGLDIIVIMPPGPLVDVIRDSVREIHIVEFNIQSISKIRKIIELSKPHLINSYLTKCSLIIAIANFKLGIPHCCTLLNAIIHEKLTPVQKSVYPLLYRIIERLSDGIIVNSQQNKDHFVDVGKLNETSIEVIYSGVDNAIPVNKIARKYADNGLVIASVGRLAPEKGHIYLLEALKYLEDIQYHCLLAGDGPMREELENFTRQNNLTDKVTFLGFRNDVAQIMDNVDVVVMPSLNETFGLTIVEAFCRRKIVIASNVGGIPEVVYHEDTGLLVAARDSKGIADMIRYCIAKPEKVIQITEKAYNLAQGKFTVNAMVTNTLNYYIRLLASCGAHTFQIKEVV